MRRPLHARLSPLRVRLLLHTVQNVHVPSFDVSTLWGLSLIFECRMADSGGEEARFQDGLRAP